MKTEKKIAEFLRLYEEDVSGNRTKIKVDGDTLMQFFTGIKSPIVKRNIIDTFENAGFHEEIAHIKALAGIQGFNDGLMSAKARETLTR